MLAGFGGVLLGAVFCLPLVPYELPGSVATLLGSAMGAGIAVAGAAIVSEQRERRDRTHVREYIVPMVEAAIVEWEHSIERVRKALTVDDDAKLTVAIHLLGGERDEAAAFVEKFDELTPIFQLVVPHGYVALTQAKQAALKWEKVVHAAYWDPPSDLVDDAQRAIKDMREALDLL